MLRPRIFIPKKRNNGNNPTNINSKTNKIKMNYPTTKDGWVSRIKALPMVGFTFNPSATVRL